MRKLKTETHHIFFIKKPTDLLMALVSANGKSKYGSSLARENNVTYSHTNKILKFLEDLSLIYFERKKKKKKLIILTEKGKEVGEHLLNIKQLTTFRIT